MRKSSVILLVAILALLCAALVVWHAVLREDRKGALTVSFLNVGQGDSIFIDAPSGRQVLIDGGPDAGVLRALSLAMPWYDRSIDLVIATHADADHIGGLIDVLSRYKVSAIMQSSVVGTTHTWSSFERLASSSGATMIEARRGQVVQLGGGAYLEVLSPDRELLSTETNTACVVTKLVYGNTSFMLPCDAPQQVENYLVALDGSALHADVLKPGHHGSKTSSSPLFVGFVDPSFAVLSRGCNNTYGFPHEETTATLRRFGIAVFDTCEQGTITFVSDGQAVARK